MQVVATLFPLVAGTFGPMASMFNICAIAIPWRVVVDTDLKEANGHRIPDPQWLVGVNIASLAIAVMANVSLLGQMTNRLRYNISGPITIVGFFISGIVDIGLVGAASSHHLPLPPTPNATYSQAFYYAAFSGGIYVILAMMLSVTAYGIWFGHYSTEFKLSMSQRSLMLQTILFLAYVLAAGGVYSRIENWSYLDANYFVVVTLFTIGFGDLVPTTHLGRSLFFPFAVGGILFVGVIIANIRTLVLESGSVKVSTRLVEKARYKAIKRGNPDQGILKLRGVKKRDTNADTELERREKEFEVMREIQLQAANNNRLFALAFATVAFMFLWFIGAVAFWQAESTSVGGEPWTYFESLYFTFVAQLTIGYGDFEP
jgi:potassium channel subfamily K